MVICYSLLWKIPHLVRWFKPIKDGNVPIFSIVFVCLPEGILSHNFGPLWVRTTHYHLTPSDGDTQSKEEAWPENPVHFHVAASTWGPHEAWPICSMVLEYLPTFARTKSPSFVVKIVKYTSTMVRIWVMTAFFEFAESLPSENFVEDGTIPDMLLCSWTRKCQGKATGKSLWRGSKRLVIFDLRALCRGPQLLWPKVAFQAKIAFWKGKPEREKHIKSYQQTCGLRKHAFCRVSTEKYPNKRLFF